MSSFEALTGNDKPKASRTALGISKEESTRVVSRAGTFTPF
eukprot:CAMPEP_0115857308 /NCGR_PEP_ID=MMETSP0287-20121206/15509_1 /TAXON_ID=412157 /ORGANISM="Chrysochromulina rotalis, Strain UIO044" /LENGTH=40 /DNA_ID= /DNA_START= /DNA_END= /DNA_ORIENTATION=